MCINLSNNFFIFLIFIHLRSYYYYFLICRFPMGCHKMESHCMSSSSPLSDTIYAKDNRPETPVREKDQQMLYYHKTQSTKSVLSHIVDKVCVRDKTFQEFRERSKSEGRIKDCPIRSKSKSGKNKFIFYINQVQI